MAENKDVSLQKLQKDIRKNLEDNASRVIPSNELIYVLDLLSIICSPKDEWDCFLCGEHLMVFRISLPPSDIGNALATDLRIVRNELISDCNMPIDFLFKQGALIGIFPSVSATACEIRYFDFSEAQCDLLMLQPWVAPSVDKLNELRKCESASEAIRYYIQESYILPPTKIEETKYIYEYLRDGFYYYNSLAPGSTPYMPCYCFCSLSGAYAPGKAIDIEYYNAIGEKDFNLQPDDSALVIGYGTGIDLIHAARCCNQVVGVEINPFSVASARANIKVSSYEARLGSSIRLLWQDMRNLNGDLPRFNKILWNIPYESSFYKPAPLTMHEFYDNYSVLEWFIPFLLQSPLLAEDWRALLWKISGDKFFARQLANIRLNVRIDDERNFCILENGGLCE